jgi:hypothetical protein
MLTPYVTLKEGNLRPDLDHTADRPFGSRVARALDMVNEKQRSRRRFKRKLDDNTAAVQIRDVPSLKHDDLREDLFLSPQPHHGRCRSDERRS